MNKPNLKVQVGDGVIISPSSSLKRSAGRERLATVSAVRPKSFDAGGLCFRMDGREWTGRSRVRLIPQSHKENESRVVAPLSDDETRRNEVAQIERARRKTENAVLAYLLTYRQEDEWLKLGLRDLRRIAALHGIPLSKRPRSKRRVSVPIEEPQLQIPVQA